MTDVIERYLIVNERERRHFLTTHKQAWKALATELSEPIGNYELLPMDIEVPTDREGQTNRILTFTYLYYINLCLDQAIKKAEKSRTVRQHTVPNFRNRLFSQELPEDLVINLYNGEFEIFPKGMPVSLQDSSDPSVSPIVVDNSLISIVNNIYDFTTDIKLPKKTVEEFFSSIETYAGQVFKNIQNGQFSLNLVDRIKISVYVLAQYLRVTIRKNSFDQSAEEIFATLQDVLGPDVYPPRIPNTGTDNFGYIILELFDSLDLISNFFSRSWTWVEMPTGTLFTLRGLSYFDNDLSILFGGGLHNTKQLILPVHPNLVLTMEQSNLGTPDKRIVATSELEKFINMMIVLSAGCEAETNSLYYRPDHSPIENKTLWTPYLRDAYYYGLDYAIIANPKQRFANQVFEVPSFFHKS